MTMYGTGLTDDGATLVGDRVGREDEVDLALLEEGLTVVGDGLDVLDLGRVLRVDAQAGDKKLGDVDVEAGGHVGTGLVEPQSGLVELHTDVDRAGLSELGHASPVVEADVLRCLDIDGVRVFAGVAACGQAEGKTCDRDRGLGSDESHLHLP